MNKRRTIYRGFNKRRKQKITKIILVLIPVICIGTYGAFKIKNSDTFKKISQKVSSFSFGKEKSAFKNFEDFGIKKEEDIKQQETENEKVTKEEVKSEAVEDVKVAITDAWSIYTLQVASVDNDKEMNKIEKQLNEKNIPFSIVELDGLKKVQTYSSFDKEALRGNLEDVKAVFSDTFISEMKVPVLSMKYTSGCSYIGDVSKLLNELVASFKVESEFWDKNKEIDTNKYKEIISKRKDIVSKIEKEVKKIDYKPAEVFKKNLTTYVSSIDEKINKSLKSCEKNETSECRGLYLSSMQGYFTFITSISKA